MERIALDTATANNDELKILASQLLTSTDPSVKQLTEAALMQMQVLQQSQAGVAQLQGGLSESFGGYATLDENTEY